MRVWQPGSHLSAQRDASVEDWTWQRTARRISTLARLTAPYKLRTVLAAVSLLAATLTALAPPFLAKLAVDDGIRKQDLSALSFIVPLFLVAGIANLATSAAQTYFTGWTGERILADLRTKLFRHLQRLSLGFYERNRAGVIISRLTNDVDALDQLVTDGVTTLVQNTLILIGSAAVLFYLDWRLALATLSVIPAMAVATAIFRIRSSHAYRAVRERLGHVTATLAEDIAGMRVVQSFTRESARRRNFEEVNAHYRAANQETVVNSGVYFPFVDFLSSVATAVVLGYGGYLVAGGDLSVGTLFAFILYVSNFFDPVQQLSQLYNTFLAAVAALDKIMDVMDEEPEVRDRPGARELGRIEGHVRLEDLRFGYGDGPEVLHGIDLDVPAGTTVALVGHTGKDESRGQRGSNAAPGDFDVHTQISGEDTKVATVIKANDLPCGPLFAYRMHKVVLGHNDDGDEISPWILDREEAEVPTKKSAFCHKNLLQLFDAINNALTEAGFDFPVPSGPTVRRCEGR